MSRILIVDDSIDLLEAMEIILIQKGFEVQTISRWHNIHSHIINFDPDLIILDIFLAGKDGREICKELRNTVVSKYLCIMMFSASSKALEDYESYGADDFLEKPFGIKNLIEKIETLLNNCKEKSF